MSDLLDHYTARRETILNSIRDLVERETMSREESRLNEIAGFVAGQLREIGGQVELIQQPGYGTHLRAGFDFGHERTERSVLVVGHLDTVWPVGSLERMPFRVTPAEGASAGGTSKGHAHGPGIFDMKSGVAIAVESLRTIVSLSLATKRPVRLLLTCDEEIGSRTSRPLIEEEAKNAAAALILEPPLTGGVVKTGRKGIGTFTVRVLGRSAHAGLDPEKGVNAIVELAHQILRLAGLNDYERGVTVSVGLIEGGSALNVVPASASAKVDVRFWTPEDGDRLIAAIRGLTPIAVGARIEVSGGINRPPMPRSEKNIALYEHARDLAAELGFDLKDDVVGGGSDGNFIAAMGTPVLDGLGVDGAGAHAEHEHIVIDDIPRRAALLTRMMQTV
ncbi:MAG: M20 family metallopeptidase [Blastocatellia bacterium]|nr:M20 family metallopeptidase [Blastocatellia bacterium]